MTNVSPLSFFFFSLHEETTELLERWAFCGWGNGGPRLHPGFPEPRTTTPEEGQGGAGT